MLLLVKSILYNSIVVAGYTTTHVLVLVIDSIASKYYTITYNNSSTGIRVISNTNTGKLFIGWLAFHL